MGPPCLGAIGGKDRKWRKTGVLKWITSLCILGGCAVLGYLKAAGHQEMVKVLCDLKTCLENLQMQIQYRAAPLPEGLRSAVFEGCNQEVEDLFCSVAEAIEQGREPATVWEREMERLTAQKGAFSRLSQQDRESIVNFCSHIGLTDMARQNDNFAYALEALNHRILELRPQAKAKCKLYQTVGILVGLMIAIMLF